jgi:hypothetical protein
MPKVYVDSRKRVQGTDEDFVFQLPTALNLSEGTAHVDTVLVPNTFYSVRTGDNDRLYVREVYDPGAAVEARRIATIAPGQYDGYSLATAVAVALNDGTTLADATPAYTVAFNSTTGRLQVSTTTGNTGEFAIYPRALLQLDLDTVWNNAPGNPPQVTLATLVDANKVCGFMGLNAITATAGTSPAVGDSMIDTFPHHNLYLHANFGQPDQSIGPNGESDIVRRIVCDAPLNGLIVDRFTTNWDVVKIAGRTLRELHFRLSDVHGKTVDLNGHHISLSVYFQ